MIPKFLKHLHFVFVLNSKLKTVLKIGQRIAEMLQFKSDFFRKSQFLQCMSKKLVLRDVNVFTRTKYQHFNLTLLFFHNQTEDPIVAHNEIVSSFYIYIFFYIFLSLDSRVFCLFSCILMSLK